MLNPKNSQNYLEKGSLPSADARTESGRQSDSFKIGGKENAGPFCTLSQARAHLSLLSAFGKLRDDVRSGKSADSEGNILGGESAPGYNEIRQRHNPNNASDDQVSEELKAQEELADRRWANYLTRATYRFELYFTHVLNEQNIGFAAKPPSILEMDPKSPLTSPEEGFHLPNFLFPPLDVALVWHSYLLNPLRAWEDSKRIKGKALVIGAEFPLESLAASLNHNLRPSTPEAARFWQDNVKSAPFHLELQPPSFAVSGQDNSAGLPFPCPRCRKAVFVSFTSFNFPALPRVLERGLSDSGWERICSGCSLNLNADVVRGAKLVADIQSWSKDPSFKMANSYVSPGKGEIFARDPADSFLCPLFAHASRPETLEMERSRSPKWDLDVYKTANKVKFSAEGLVKEMKNYFLLRLRRVRMSKTFDSLVAKRCRILFGSYLEGDVVGKASLDLVAAVQRQGSFVSEMAKLGWSDPKRLSEGLDDGGIARGLVRYHNWLDLMSMESALLCPTLDIDLMWHTHQLLRRYTRDMVFYVGRYVDHNDKIEEGALASAFEETAKKWKKKFHQNYSECGCLHNKPKTSQVLARALTTNNGSLIQRIRSANEKPGELDEGAFNDSTHPSTHNGVAVRGAEWDRKRKQRRRQVDREIKKGKRRPGHGDPFIAGYGYAGLYPFFYTPPIIWVDGGVGGGVGSCVAASCGSAGCASATGACATGSSSCGMAGCGGSGGFGCGGGGGGCGGGGGGCGGGGGGGC